MTMKDADDGGTGVIARPAGAGAFLTEIAVRGGTILVDEPASVRGTDAGPTPYELLSAALAACTSMTLRLYAARKGWTLPDFTVEVAHSLVRGADGSRFSLRLLPAPWFEQTRATGDYVRQALEAVGINVEIVNNDPAGHTKAVYTDHDFDLAIGSPVWRNDPAISTTILYQGGLPAGVPFSNQYGYADPEMDKIIAAASETADPAERIQLYNDMGSNDS